MTNFEDLKKMVYNIEADYESQMDEDLGRIDIRDSVLSDSLKNQIELQLIWEDLHKRIELVASDLDVECDKMFSIAFKDLINDSYKKLSIQEAKIFAQSDGDYIDTVKVKNKAVNLKLKVAGVLDTIKSRKFILKNLCEALKDNHDSYVI